MLGEWLVAGKRRSLQMIDGCMMAVKRNYANAKLSDYRIQIHLVAVATFLHMAGNDHL